MMGRIVDELNAAKGVVEVPVAVVDRDDIFIGIGDEDEDTVSADSPNTKEMSIETELAYYKNLKGLPV
jgi:hypothetical protein